VRQRLSSSITCPRFLDPYFRLVEKASKICTPLTDTAIRNAKRKDPPNAFAQADKIQGLEIRAIG
jgi:hypothetical protein